MLTSTVFNFIKFLNTYNTQEKNEKLFYVDLCNQKWSYFNILFVLFSQQFSLSQQQQQKKLKALNVRKQTTIKMNMENFIPWPA